MRELVELQTGQVAFISGLMSGFSLSVAAHVLRYGIRSRMAQVVFVLLLLASLSFLLALYVDTRLSIELAGLTTLEGDVAARVAAVRAMGTTGATVAFVIFVVAIGLLGWLATPLTGAISSALAGSLLALLYVAWRDIGSIAATIALSIDQAAAL